MSIDDTIRSLVDRYRNPEEVERQFARLLQEDPRLREAYSEWCAELGYAPKWGYRERVREIFEQEGSVWDSLTEFEDEL